MKKDGGRYRSGEQEMRTNVFKKREDEEEKEEVSVMIRAKKKKKEVGKCRADFQR